MALGTIFVELDLSFDKWDRSTNLVLSRSKKASDVMEQNWRTLGNKSDTIFQAMANGAILAYEKISKRAQLSAQEQFRAQSAMVSKVSALNIKQAENPLYKTLGIKSAAMINAQEKAILQSYNTIKTSGQATAQDLVNIERAKNRKLKNLADERVAHHKMSMAAMTRAVLRFYAAWFVASNAARVVTGFVLEGVKAIDELKVSTIAVAAQITSMQGPKDVTENFKRNVEYAKGLNVELQRADALSFANLQQIQMMNRSMVNQGVLLDHNNEKQMESFIALSNAVAMFTQGQDKTKQASQEIRALFTGQVRAGDMVARQIDSLIKKEGIYADGLKEVVKLGRENGDTLERMQPYLIGIIEASDDIMMTWEAVSSSLETSWRIIQRGVFKDIYKDVTEAGRNFTETLKENENAIVASIRNIYETVAFAVKSTIVLLTTFGTVAWVNAIRAGDAAAWFALRWDKMTTSVVMSTSKMALGFSAFVAGIVGFSIGRWLSNEFEWVRKVGVHVTFALIDAWKEFVLQVKLGWEEAKAMAQRVKAVVTDDTFEDINRRSALRKVAMRQAAIAEKETRDLIRAERLAEVTDEAIATAKALQAATAKVTLPDVGTGSALDPKEEKKMMTFRMQELKKLYETEIEMADHLHTMRVMRGENELKVTMDTIDAKVVALENWNSLSEAAIIKGVSDEKERTAKLIILNADYIKRLQGLHSKRLEVALKLQMSEAAMLADYYKDISGFEDEYRKHKLEAIEIERKAAIAAYGDIEAANKKSSDAIGKVDQELFTAKANQINKALDNAAGMFTSISGMYGELSSEYTLMQDSAQAMIVLQKAVAVATAVAAIANQGLGDPYTAFARITAMAAAMGSLLMSIGESVGGGGGSAAVTKNAYGDDTTVFGGANDMASRSLENSVGLLEDIYTVEKTYLMGIHDSIKELNLNIQGIVKEIIGVGSGLGVPFGRSDTSRNLLNDINMGFGAFEFLGNINNWMQGISDQIFGKTTRELQGSGLAVGGGSARSYTDVFEKKHGSFFGLIGGSESSYTTYGAANEELTRLFFAPDGIYATLRLSLSDMAEMLGGDASKATNYVFETFKIDLRNLTADEISEALNAKISEIGDKMATAVLGDIVEIYRKVGEGALETAVRLSVDKAVVVDLLDLVGKTVAGTMSEVIALSESLIYFAGSLEDLSESTANYYDKFFTDAEKHIDLQETLSDIMDTINQTLPDTRDGYRLLVEGMDLTTESGQLAYVTLLKAADAADRYYETIEEIEEQRLDSASAFISLFQNLSTIRSPGQDDIATLMSRYSDSLAQFNALDTNEADYYDNALGLMTEQVDLISQLTALSEKQVAQSDRINSSLQDMLDSLTGGVLAPTDNFAAQQAKLGDLFETLSTSTDLDVLEKATSELSSFLPEFLSYATDYGLDYNQIVSGLSRQIEFAMARVEDIRAAAEGVGTMETFNTSVPLAGIIETLGGTTATLDEAATMMYNAAMAFRRFVHGVGGDAIQNIEPQFNPTIDMYGSGSMDSEGEGDMAEKIVVALYDIADDEGTPQVFQLVVDGRVIGDVVAAQAPTNTNMINSLRRNIISGPRASGN